MNEWKEGASSLKVHWVISQAAAMFIFTEIICFNLPQNPVIAANPYLCASCRMASDMEIACLLLSYSHQMFA